MYVLDTDILSLIQEVIRESVSGAGAWILRTSRSRSSLESKSLRHASTTS